MAVHSDMPRVATMSLASKLSWDAGRFRQPQYLLLC
jgi:hypothetical protein